MAKFRFRVPVCDYLLDSLDLTPTENPFSYLFDKKFMNILKG